jgi:pyruvate/2-oxoacid:ferredoxin oxidoreductase beta subunit
MRRNVDLLYIVMDNQIYGLTRISLARRDPKPDTSF